MANYFDGVSEAETKWLQEKWGMFSASRIEALRKTGKRPMTAEELKQRPSGDTKKTVDTMFGEAALTYIQEVATEAVSIFNTEGAFDTRAMRKGRLNEPLSFVALERRLGLQGTGILHYCGGENPIFKKYCKDSGASPDLLGKEEDGKISFGGELKNPDAKTHFYYLRKMRNQHQLRIEEPDYFSQCQFSMMAFNVTHWLFGSFNEHMKEPDDRLLYFYVKADRNFQTDLKMRLRMAVKMKNDMIEEAKANRNKNTSSNEDGI